MRMGKNRSIGLYERSMTRHPKIWPRIGCGLPAESSSRK